MPRIPGRPCWHEQPSPASQICQTRNVLCDRTPWSQGGQASSLSSATSFFSLDMRRFGSSSCREQTEAGNPGQNTKQSKFLVYPGIVGDLSNSLGKTLVQSFGPRFCRPACTAGMQRHVEMDSGMLEACRPHSSGFFPHCRIEAAGTSAAIQPTMVVRPGLAKNVRFPCKIGECKSVSVPGIAAIATQRVAKNTGHHGVTVRYMCLPRVRRRPRQRFQAVRPAHPLIENARPQ